MAEAAAESHDRGQGFLRRWAPLLVFAGLAASVLLGGVIAYERLGAEIKRRTQLDLYAVASLKSKQVSAWLGERRADAERMMGAPAFTVMLARWLAEGQPAGEFRDTLRNRLDDFRRLGRYRAIMLLDADANPVLAAGPADGPTPDERALALGVLGGGELAMSDIHWEGAEGESVPGIDLAAPLYVASAAGRREIGALVFQLDAREYLYPLLQSWSASSRSGEALLLRVAGGEVIYLNELRHRGDAALRLRAPMASTSLVGAMILRRGGEGAVEGVDYRGVPVLAAGLPVTGTTWHLVVKVDREEVYAPVRSLAVFLVALVVVLIAAAGLAVWLWWSGQRAAFESSRLRLELARQNLAERLQVLFRHSHDAILLMDGEGRVLEANDRAVRAYGYSPEELRAMHARDFRAPQALAEFERDRQQMAAQGGRIYETLHRRKDGSVFPVEISGRFFEAAGERFWQSIIRDVSERKAAEVRLARLNRLYAALSETNEAIVRAEDRDELFRTICRIAVERGGLAMAWIGLLEPQGDEVVPAAWFGAGPAWFARVRPFRLGRPPRAPVEIALGEDRAYFCNDLEGDARLAPIQGELRAAGYRAAASFPLRVGERVAGALTLFAGESDFFDGELATLVTDMAVDVSFALEYFEKEAARRQAEQRLRKLSHALEQSPASTVITDAEGRIEYVNPKFTAVTGYELEEVRGRTPAVIKSGLTPEAVYRELWATIAAGQTWSGVIRNRRKDGTLYWDRQAISSLRDEQGRITNFVAVKEDVTSVKETEVQLRNLNRSLRMLSQCNEALVRATDERELLMAICRIAVEVGGFRMAWVGAAERDAVKSVRPLGWAGTSYDYIESLRATWDDVERGRGVTGTAIRTGAPAVVHDAGSDPRMDPWREQVLAGGYRSFVGLPLKHAEEVFGALTISSAEAGVFDAQEVVLLEQLASDLAYGLAALRTAAEQRTLLGSAGVGVAFIRDREIVRCNRAFADLFGYDDAELAGSSTRPLYTDEADYELYGRDAYAAVARGDTHDADVRQRRRDGTTFWANLTMSAIDAPDPTKGVVVVVQDIDRRKRAESTAQRYAGELRDLSRRLVETEEIERRNLARELHDRIGSNVSSLGLTLSLMQGALPAQALERVRPQAEDCAALIEQTGRLVRDLMGELRPPGLDELGLFAALQDLAGLVAKRAGLAVAVGGREFEPRLARVAEITLFRIAQEALNNAVKHARATAAEVRLETGSNGAVLTIADDGRGFDSSAPPPAGHLGLVGMRERAEAIGARLRVESAPGAGTRVIVELPLAQRPPIAAA